MTELAVIYICGAVILTIVLVLGMQHIRRGQKKSGGLKFAGETKIDDGRTVYILRCNYCPIMFLHISGDDRYPFRCPKCSCSTTYY